MPRRDLLGRVQPSIFVRQYKLIQDSSTTEEETEVSSMTGSRRALEAHSTGEFEIRAQEHGGTPCALLYIPYMNVRV